MSHETLLIVAQSGRLLAELAARIGQRAVVIDHYGDRDTRQWARAVFTVAQFDVASLAARIAALTTRWTIRQVLYGSGLEAHPQSLMWLAQRFDVAGCTADVMRTLHDKPKFFTQLRNLRIDFPEVRFTPPPDTAGWLLKPYYGCGGGGVVWAELRHEGDPARDRYYWQRWQAGRALSLLAFADSARTQIIGFHRLYHRALHHEAFRFSGLDNRVQLPKGVRMQWAEYAEQLANAFQLRGLFGIDFLWDGHNAWFLEINARPPASLAVYEPRYASRWLAAHLGATPPSWSARRRITRHYQICYVDHPCRIPASLTWPAWVADQPLAGTALPAHAPLCSFVTTGRKARGVKRTLQQRKTFLYHLINN